MAETRLSFKEMCAKFDVTPRTLRYYEYIELLSPERQGRSRFYGPKEIARMTLILRGRRWGFALEDLRQWLMIYEQDGSDKQMATFIDLAEKQLLELRAKEVELKQVISELEGLKNSVKGELGAAETES